MTIASIAVEELLLILKIAFVVVLYLCAFIGMLALFTWGFRR